MFSAALLSIIAAPLSLALVILAPAPAPAAEAARGVVYEDRDGDGQRDPDEPGLGGVRVSNGERVVQTDEQGAWSLPAGDETIFFVTKPAGFMTPVDGAMLPRFYYIHQPAGSPSHLLFPGVAPTGPLPESIDFALRRIEEPARFEAILLADPQPQTEAEVDFLRDDLIAELLGTHARFGMTMGDILFDDLALFPRWNAIVAQIGVPWYNVPGNHEMNLDAPDDRHSLETFKRVYGPPYYSFEVGEAVFIVLDNIDYKGGGTADPGDVRGKGGYEARIGKRQLRWLKRELSLVPEEKLVFLAMHAPLGSYLGDRKGINTQDRRQLFDLLSGRSHLYAVAGHTHTTEHHYFGKDDGFDGPGELHHHVLATGSGGWWSGPMDDRGIPTTTQRDGTPNGYHVLEVDGVELTVRYKAASRPAADQLRIVLDTTWSQYADEVQRDFRHGELADGRLSVDAVPSARVFVNLFDGGPRSKVEMKVGDRAFTPLQRVSQPDPYMLELYARHKQTVKPWLEALPSSHLWRGALPADLRAGTTTLTVRAVDEFGRVHHAHRVLEIEGSSAP